MKKILTFFTPRIDDQWGCKICKRGIMTSTRLSRLMLHCYRYVWAERFATSFGAQPQGVHWAYAKHAKFTVPSRRIHRRRISCRYDDV